MQVLWGSGLSQLGRSLILEQRIRVLDTLCLLVLALQCYKQISLKSFSFLPNARVNYCKRTTVSLPLIHNNAIKRNDRVFLADTRPGSRLLVEDSFAFTTVGTEAMEGLMSELVALTTDSHHFAWQSSGRTLSYASLHSSLHQPSQSVRC